MKALSKSLATAALLVMLVALPSTLVAFRFMLDETTVNAPQFVSPVDEARFWSHMFGP
jgi:hypothetical protein